jgi:hypothetical protein
VRELVIPCGNSGHVVQYVVADNCATVARIFHAREDR